MIQLIQTSLLTYGVILPSPFFKTQRGADHQFWPSDKIELFCREDKNYLKRFFTYTCILFLIWMKFYVVPKTFDTERREEKGDEKSSDKCPWTQPEVCAVEKHMQSFINDLVTPGKLDCLQVKRRCGAVLRGRSWKQIKFYVYNRVLKRRRMQSTEWGSDRQLIVKTCNCKNFLTGIFLFLHEEHVVFIFCCLCRQMYLYFNYQRLRKVLPIEVFSYLPFPFFILHTCI